MQKTTYPLKIDTTGYRDGKNAERKEVCEKMYNKS